MKEQAVQSIKSQRLENLFQQDPQRAEKFNCEVGNIYLDYSKNFVTTEIMNDLVEWAKSQNLESAIQQLLKGDCVNTTEKRPALHTALRKHADDSLILNGQDIIPLIQAQKAKMADIVSRLQQGHWKGATGQTITDIVNIGIGGSDLGPLMTVEALAHYQQSSLKLHFVSNIDPVAIDSVIQKLDPAKTVFIISSKSFGTPETLTNTEVAKQWLKQQLKTDTLEAHFIAVTANPTKAQQYGISTENILTFWEWIGGRYSIWSTIGLPLAISIGMDHFEQFLAGGRLMDEHFAKAPLAQNMPVILALIGCWYIQYFNAPTIAVLPYAQGLRRLSDYLQQLDMESNGKACQRHGEKVTYATGPIVWGQAGTNGQHAFYQLLHQGTHFIPVDFIVAAKTHTDYPQLQQQLIANCFAQAQALMQGKQDVNANDFMPGNKPSNMLLVTELTPFSLGQLMALYEHKVYVQGVMWGINSFDQPGVELGKKLANNVMNNFSADQFDPSLDPSTQHLLRKLRRS